ncbi:type II secretion system protein [Bacillus sp. B15-48]|uniref:type IV pilus modification PilV family protein n=1 Tax=Bacillus sp. B15-48 TaxID=1548601 RepID=UPI00193FE4D5|nr:type II secretion system protein [Bacillus sp. B15-48]MBM4761887.1 hypothetical protein [Bacillus sp. B15-48]
MPNDRGFTLVEILVSFLILFLIGTVFFQFFTISQKTTMGNQDKLVAVNLAKFFLEQVKAGEIAEIDDVGIYGSNNCQTEAGCSDDYIKTVNNKRYSIKVEVNETGETDEGEIRLYVVKIEVYHNDQKPITTLEGLVEL